MLFKIEHNGNEIRPDTKRLDGLHCHSERDALHAIAESEYPQDYTVVELRQWCAVGGPESEAEVAHSLRHATCPPAVGQCVGGGFCPYS